MGFLILSNRFLSSYRKGNSCNLDQTLDPQYSHAFWQLRCLLRSGNILDKKLLSLVWLVHNFDK